MTTKFLYNLVLLSIKVGIMLCYDIIYIINCTTFLFNLSPQAKFIHQQTPIQLPTA